MRRPQGRSARTPTTGEGAAYLYIAPCRHEDILKLGFSRDPLRRLQSLHPRWFEFFDVDAASLVETDTVREARVLELQLRHAILPLNAPSPLVVVRAAAGHTEWFRGAAAELDAAIARLAAEGHVVHRPPRDWLRQRLAAQSDRLFHWSDETLQAIEQARHVEAPPEQVAALERMLRNTLDAYPALELDLRERVPDSVADWHAARL